jgi:beta-galactosidase
MRIRLLTLALCSALAGHAQQRQETTLTDNWQFSHDKQSWQAVSVPHDWAISGPFDKKWDLQVVRIEQNGEKEATEKSGRSGALPWIGKGHYKRKFTIPSGFSGHAELLFDGAMAEPTVYVNGRQAGYWPYGYNTFRVDATPFIREGENELSVDLQNLEESSRWYPGAGLYRPVTLILTPAKSYIDDWSIFVRPDNSKKVKEGEDVLMTLDLAFANPVRNQQYEVDILDGDGNTVASGQRQAYDYTTGRAAYQFGVKNARLWSPETPYLYQAVVSLYDGDRKIDEKRQRFGIRTVSVSAKGGFQLNGVTRKLRGVCLHHDLGPLGAAVNKAALIRQIKIMKEMGCDAIRTAHNMPSQMQMDVCDSLGMMVMAESFDMWNYKKCRNGYARFFSEWADRDIENLVRAHRNHPSIIMWSIGNEIPEQGMAGGRETAMHLQDLCHQLDPTRPVTQGMDRAENALSTGFAQAMDVPGFNYRVHKYEKNISQLWQGFLLGSETASTVSSRGVYKFPVKVTDNSQYASWAKNYDPEAIKKADGQCSSYDVEYCSWSNLPDDDWVWQDDKPWVIGEFVWTGFDYLGEPTPYDEYWPSRSSYFGICDLAGLPKDRYWLYRSHWRKDDHTIHLLPHWTWPGRKGEVTPVYCYTDYPEAELFVNGKSQGRIRKNPKERLDRYRLRWNDVTYEPGELKVVVYDEAGRSCGQQVVRTAGKPARLKLDVWTQQSGGSPLAAHAAPLKADGDDLAFITVSLTDNKGTLIADAQDQLTFEVSGAGSFRAACNGDATSLEPFTEPTMRLFNGQLVVVVQASRLPGRLKLKVGDAQRRLTATAVIDVKP